MRGPLIIALLCGAVWGFIGATIMWKGMRWYLMPFMEVATPQPTVRCFVPKGHGSVGCNGWLPDGCMRVIIPRGFLGLNP